MYKCKHCGANLLDNLGYDALVPTYFDDNHQLVSDETKEILRYWCQECEHTIRRDYADKIHDKILEL